MKFFYYLLQIPPFFFLLLCILVFGLFNIIATVIARKHRTLNTQKSNNEIIGQLFAVLGGFYALLLSFVVFLVWDAYTQAETNSNREGSLAKSMYWDIRYFPDSVKTKELMACYVDYVSGVINHEYPAMEKLDFVPVKYRVAFNRVFYEMELLDPHDPRIQEMFRHLNDLAISRSLRLLNGSSEIPAEIWYALIAGTLIIMVLATMLEVRSAKLHMVMTGLLGMFIGVVLFIVITLDHPFSGKIRIEPIDYQIILKMNSQHQLSSI